MKELIKAVAIIGAWLIYVAMWIVIIGLPICFLLAMDVAITNTPH